MSFFFLLFFTRMFSLAEVVPWQGRPNKQTGQDLGLGTYLLPSSRTAHFRGAPPITRLSRLPVTVACNLPLSGPVKTSPKTMPVLRRVAGTCLHVFYRIGLISIAPTPRSHLVYYQNISPGHWLASCASASERR
ncbi:hypothetical protein EDD15DRAFT_1439528 [Pisolithus albus]|nr:hypothetical protein EDD15DRAFT_1439528 [Pisolithus albus]